MKSFNITEIGGMVCTEPELKFSGSGTPICSWKMATNRKAGQEEKTTWWRITAFSKTAELANQFLKKGSNVFVSGEADLDEYTDKEGAKRSTLNLIVNNMRFLDGKNDAEAQPRAQAAMAGSDDSDSMPF